VHDGFVPSYRVALYERLAHAGDIDYVVFHSDPPKDIAHLAAHPPFAFAHRYVPQRSLRTAGRTVFHQHLVKEIVRDYDAVVLGAWLRYASTHAVRLAFARRRRPVIYWGVGGTAPREATGLPRTVIDLRESIKLTLARSVDAYLAYTQGGAAALTDHGVDPRRVFVLGNTLDTDHLAALAADAREQVDAVAFGLRPDTPVLVYLGRFVPDKRVDDLLDVAHAVNRNRATPAHFVLIGDGPEHARIAERAADHPHVQLTGALDDAAVAHWLARATAVVAPGRVGLVANHAFANGVPLVARVTDLNAPEVEYVRHGENGLLVRGDLDAFATAIGDLIDDPVRRHTLAVRARETAATLNIDTMAARFDAGVRYALGIDVGARSNAYLAYPRSSRRPRTPIL
jgi:glycosyltransferase involved in cell wall biosynthesis